MQSKENGDQVHVALQEERSKVIEINNSMQDAHLTKEDQEERIKKTRMTTSRIPSPPASQEKRLRTVQ